MPDDLIKLLEFFNRKERFFLVRQALGKEEFRLSEDFRDSLQNAVGLKEKIPDNAFVAMDYHLDWIAAALTKYANKGDMHVFANVKNEDKRLVMGNQEDVDLLVAFRDRRNVYKLIFVEAKGYTPWHAAQLKSKLKRVALIFEHSGIEVNEVKHYFCLVSPCSPEGKDFTKWPELRRKSDGALCWFKLRLPQCRLKVTRWDSVKRMRSKDGGHFQIVLRGKRTSSRV